MFRDDLDLTAHMLKEHGGLNNGQRVIIDPIHITCIVDILVNYPLSTIPVGFRQMKIRMKINNRLKLKRGVLRRGLNIT